MDPVPRWAVEVRESCLSPRDLDAMRDGSAADMKGISPPSSSSSKPSTLPAWFLDMQTSLETSKSSLIRATGRINDLSDSVAELSTSIDKLMVDSPEYIARRLRMDTLMKGRAGLTLSALGAFVNDMDDERKRNKVVLNDVLWPELWGRVVSFLPNREMLQLEGVCRPIRELHMSGLFFRDRSLYPADLYCGDFKTRFREQSRCYWFIARSLQQLVTPTERIAQLQNMFKSSCSHVDTFEYFHKDTISVLNGFLSHQNGSIRDLSCAIIGNLLCWEVWHGELPTISPRAQAKAANATRRICLLLTSPSASVNLAQSKHSNMSHDRTSSIRGISTKRGARALCNLVSEYPIPEEEEATREILPAAGNQYMFQFFHKSGAFKETYVADFYVDDSGHVSGAGEDDTGEMAIRGEAVQDIDGQVYLYKQFSAGNSRPYLNVVAYWANGVDVGEAQLTQRYGAGFYGVWEHWNAEPHFELKKGGVFRAVPI